MSINLLHLVTGQTIACRVKDITEDGEIVVENPISVDLVPTEKGMQVTTGPFCGIIGLMSERETVNINAIHVVTQIPAPEQIEKIWTQATSRIQLV